MDDIDIDEIVDRLLENGQMPAPQEVLDLCECAKDGAQAAATLEALVKALRKAGWGVIDTTTDDDDSSVIELIPPE